ncbi:ML domain-containing protein [Amanita rubescens]|nr:ML domain-containing protein [Amanita rubescens]
MARFALLSLIPFLLVLCVTASPAAPQFPTDPEIPVRTNQKWSYTNCGLETDAVQLKSLEVFPDPPKPGQNLTIKAKGIVVDEIDDGAYADVTVKLGLIKLLGKRFDVCEEARNANVSITCPVEPGTYTVEQTVKLPEEIPRAIFKVEVRGYTADDEDMLCLDLRVDFMPFFMDW